MFNFRVAGFLFQIETAKERAMRPRMGNYRPFEADEDAAVGERPLFRLALDGRITLPDAEPALLFPYDLTDDKAALRVYDDRCILSVTHSRSGVEYLMEWPLARTGGMGDADGRGGVGDSGGTGGTGGTGNSGVNGGADDPSASETGMDASGNRDDALGNRDDATGAGYVFTCDLTTKGVAPPPHILDHFAVQAFSFASADRHTLLIHASTIVYEGKAVMFLAESGTGKSTHTRLWRENIEGAELLNDDAPALRIVDGEAIVYGTPWSGKLPCYKNERYPLAACVRIRRADYNKMHEQSAIAAFGALLPSTLPTLQQREDTLDAICDTLSAILAATPVYILDCLPDADAARTSRRALFPQND